MINKITLILFLLPALILATNPELSGKYTKEKKINKEFTVSADALLKLDNSYGHLYVTSWNQNKVVIEVSIKTSSNNEEKAQRKLDEITVDFDASSSMVSAKTVFEKSNWGWNWGKNSNVSMEINYTVKVPVTNKVDLSNDYGSINLDKINGVAKISCDYGKLKIGELNADNNLLSFDYTSGSTIEYMKSGKISADYSGYELMKTGNIEISADYTNSSIGKADNVDYSCDYGSIKIENARNLKGNGDYLSTKLGEISGNIEITSDYGSIKIDRLTPSAGNVMINSDYTGIKIGYDPSYHFDFEIKLQYAGLGGEDDWNMKVRTEKSSDKYYQGYYGSTGKRKVSIHSEYGGVTFYKN